MNYLSLKTKLYSFLRLIPAPEDHGHEVRHPECECRKFARCLKCLGLIK